MQIRKFALWIGLFTLLGSGAAQAASYLTIFGTIIDPIQNTYGGDSAYSGSNVEPDTNLSNANLAYADLYGADLRFAGLSGASLLGADLTQADLSAQLGSANLSNSILYSANLEDANNWSSATWTGAKYSLNAVDNSGNAIADTIFPVGMDQAWRDAAGMVAVPEPATVLLFGLGLVALAARRRQS